MKDRSLPKHWLTANGRYAVRNDGVEICFENRHHALVIKNVDGQALGQRTIGGGIRPRLFRYIDAAARTADKVWPLREDHEAAYRLVADKQDRRRPINAIVPADKLVAVVKAVAYFTSKEVTVSVENGMFRVKSAE